MGKQLDLVLDDALRAPIWRKTSTRERVPVRRNSFPRGRERGFYRPMSAARMHVLLRAAERLELTARLSGKKNGPLGHVGLEVLRELARLIDYRSGRLEPCYDTIATNIRRARSAVIEAMARLRQAGLLEWMRRHEPDPTKAGQRGPQIKQISNAYRFAIPAFVKALLGPRVDPPPLPLDDEARRAEWRRARDLMECEAEDPLFRALDALAGKIAAKGGA